MAWAGATASGSGPRADGGFRARGAEAQKVSQVLLAGALMGAQAGLLSGAFPGSSRDDRGTGAF